VTNAPCRLFLVAASLLAASGCKRAPPATTAVTDAGAPPASAPTVAVADAAPPKRVRRPGTDVTFLVVSDTHFGFGDIQKEHDALVPKLNATAGRPYPRSVGGNVGVPRGLVVTGDLTEWGKVEEWQPFVATYGLHGTEAKLAMPVFEMIGNHDKVHGPWVEEQVAKRHGGRFYAWDWDDVHLVALGEAPDDEGLAFLAKDLERVDTNVPVFLFFHLALEGPWSTGHWFGDGDYKKRLAALLRGRFTAAIFHGHHHATGHYVWDGIDVVKPGAVKGGAHTFAVVHVTSERFTVASYDWDHDTWGASFARDLPR